MSDSRKPPSYRSDAETKRVEPQAAREPSEAGRPPISARGLLPTAEELQKSFPQYEILSLLGRGGMGAVYKAKQKALDRFVAIKVLTPELSGIADFAARFEREARAMARLNHPNIVTVHDSGRTPEGRFFFVMEFVDGTDLAELIRKGLLDPTKTLAITAQVCEALAYAHAQGIVHRDIKPANVMVDIAGRAKVADFGLARLIGPELDPGFTSTGTVIGTLDYMAPEQRSGMHVDHRADIFSLGVMVYEMFCHEVPRGIFPPPSQRSGCDQRIDEIVRRAMQQQPDLRYQNTGEFKTDVDVIRNPDRASAAGQKSRTWLYAAVAAVLALATVALLMQNFAGTPRGGGKMLPVLPDAQSAPVWKWKDWLAEQTGGGNVPGGLVKVSGGWMTQVQADKQEVFLKCGPETRDQGLRVTYMPAPDGSDAELQVILRSDEHFELLYRAHASPEEWVIYRRDSKKRLVALDTVPRNAAMNAPGERVVEFRAIGDTLTFLFNGEQMAVVKDSHLAIGMPRVSCRDGILLKKIELLEVISPER